MRGVRLLGILFVIGLFVFGCTGQGGAQANTTPSGGAPSGAGSQAGTPSAAGGGSNTSGGSAPSAPGGNPTSPPSMGANATANSSNSLAGLGYAGLLALGVPVQCQITVTQNGKTNSFNTYFDGKGNIRVEIPSTASDTGTTTCSGGMVSITSKTASDVGCVGGQLFQGCDWLEIPINASASTSPGSPSAAPSTYQAPDLTNVPTTSFNCQPWTYDASKFQTPGKVCSLQDMIKNAEAGAGTGSYG